MCADELKLKLSCIERGCMKFHQQLKRKYARMKRFWPMMPLLAVILSFYSCSPDLPEDVAMEYDHLPKKLDYNIHIKPILSDKCFACHGPDKAKQEAGLRLDMEASAYAELPETPGKWAISPGNLSKSELYHRILSDDPDQVMPTPESHLSLSAREKALLIRWIEDGAVYKPHWAFMKPEMPDIPKVKLKGFATNNPIDNFIFNKLQEEGLRPSPEAPKDLLLRRLSLDLTGLPPSVAQIDSFLRDNADDAYEKQVDRLLASPHYGERMATDWLDLARFADSHGYTVDRLRDMSPYRDWVIRAFNSNQPYDQFLHWQLAGDLMPQPTKEMMIATAFNRNHQQNMEGGIVEEEFQTEYVLDRTNTFGDAILGVTLSCARCHDHKYDPVSQKEYFQLFSFFNNVREAGQISWDDAMPSPTILLPDEQKEKLISFMSNTISQQEKTVDERIVSDEAGFDRWLKSGEYHQLAKKAFANRLQAHYDFNKGKAINLVTGLDNSRMERDGTSDGGAPQFGPGHSGKGLALNGDIWMHLKGVAVFRKSDPFTISMWMKIPKDLDEGVLFHKSIAERLYNFRGFHLYLKDDRLELSMAHAAPGNAITRLSPAGVPRDRWINVAITYDGAAKADGFRLYLDGSEVKMETITDALTKDILFYSSEQAGLQIGGWYRGRGLTGGSVDDVLVYERELTPFEISVNAGKADWQAIVSKQPGQLTNDEVSDLRRYYFAAVSTLVLQAKKELQEARVALADSIERVPELMVMREMVVPRKTFVLERGNYDAPGEQVSPNTPAAILNMPADLPRNRYGLAQWATHKDNPLTARVAINRYWQLLFGTGIVKTAEDFGNQGEMPSHPELLDWLAVTFRYSGWDVKKMIKLMVMSAAYRQDSKASKEAVEKDPENRLLSHGPAHRLTAEMIRDNALFASGLLNPAIGGKSIKPYQPEGLWSINSAVYTPSAGTDVYRRSLYVIVKRTVPNPTLSTFDAGSRSYCIVRRQPTNTPLQALVTLNDPTFVEAAAVIGENIAREQDVTKGVLRAYRQLTGKTPSQEEMALLMELQRKESEKFRKYPGKTAGWLSAGQYRLAEGLDTALVASCAVVASTIMNSDATLTKR